MYILGIFLILFLIVLLFLTYYFTSSRHYMYGIDVTVLYRTLKKYGNEIVINNESVLVLEDSHIDDMYYFKVNGEIFETVFISVDERVEGVNLKFNDVWNKDIVKTVKHHYKKITKRVEEIDEEQDKLENYYKQLTQK